MNIFKVSTFVPFLAFIKSFVESCFSSTFIASSIVEILSVYNPTDKIWPYFMSSEMNEPFNEYGLLNIVSFDPNIIKLTYEKFTFDELLSSVINLKLRRPENTDYPDINRLKEDIYYVSALIYTSCIEFIEFYIKNELKYLEDNELYNYVDFLFTYNNDNTDKYTYKNFELC